MRERPSSDVARRCDGVLTAGHLCHGGSMLIKDSLFILLMPDAIFHGGLF